jgi:hypothetical protein
LENNKNNSIIPIKYNNYELERQNYYSNTNKNLKIELKNNQEQIIDLIKSKYVLFIDNGVFFYRNLWVIC